MKTSKSSSKSKRSISRVHIGVLLVVFIALSATISVLAFNASALPEGYTYVDGGGIYFFGDTSSYYSNDIIGLEILTTDNDVEAVSKADLANRVKYPELNYSFKQIEAYADDVCVAKTKEYNFDMCFSEFGIINKSDVSLLGRYFNNYYIGELYDTSSTRSYYSESALKSKYSTATNFYYKIVSIDGTSFTVPSLEMYDVYNAMRAALGYADDEAYAPSYYKTYDGQKVLATYTLKPSSALKNTAFYIGDVKVPLKKDSYGNYFQPCYRLIYASGKSDQMGNYSETLSVCNGNPIFAFCEFGGNSTVSTCTPDGENRIIDYLVASTYAYRTILPAVVTFEYDLDDDVVDANDPTLEENSRIDPIYTTKLVDTQNKYVASVKLNDGKNISKGQSHLDKWVVGVPSQQVNPGDAMAVCVNGSSGYETIDGAIYAGLDANTGAFRYYYRITATWRDYTKLRYDLNISQSVNYVQGSDDSYYSYYDTENDPVFYDAGEYSGTVPATLTSTTYSYYGDTYVFAGWTKDFKTNILKKTNEGYVDANGNSYTFDQFLNYNADDPSANEINMSEDHTLYAAWAIADDVADNFIKVTAKITNGKFVFESINDDGYTYSPSSSWLSATGGSTFVDRTSSYNDLIFVSMPNDGYNAYKYKYHLGTDEVTNGYGNVPLLLGSSYQGHGDNLCYSDFYYATSDEEYYYEIEYVKYGPCVLTFYKNEPGNSDPYDTTCYSVNDLYYSMEYDLSKYYEIQDDGSVKLLNVKDSQSFDSISDASYQVDGYNFVGWARLTTDDAGYPTYDESKLLTSISFKESTGYYMDLVAVWEAPKPEYDVIYYTDTDKGTVLDTQSYPADSEVTVGLSEGKSNPTKTGYTFSGWNCVTSGVTVTDSKFTMPENAVELVPEWTANKHTVTYTVTGAPDGYTAPEAATVAYGTEVTVEDAPSVTGYTFAGWTTTDVTVEDGKFTMPDKNVTLTGVFTAKSYNVIYYTDTDKATALDTQAQTFGTSVTVGLSEGKDEPTKAGHTFAGWNCVTSGVTVTDSKFTMPDSNVEFVPEWTVNKHTVTYTVTGAPDGYTVPASATVAYGTEVTVEDAPSVTGYTFAGWTTTDVTVEDGKFTMPDKNVTLTGVFTAKSYNVIYYTDTDKATQLDKQTKTFGTSVTVGLSEGKDEPTKAGHTFAGWKCVTSGVTVTDSKFTMPDSNVEFVPEWTVNKHTVTYTVTGAPSGYTVPASATVAYGTEVTVAATPSVTGYTFAGWTTTDVTVEDGKFTMPDKNVTLTGVFTAKSYNVIYYTDTDKATALDTQAQTFGTSVTVGLSEGKDEPTKAGHTFSGWKCVTSGVTVTDSKFTMPDSNVEFVPEWTVNKHTVTYTVTGAPSGYTVPASATVAYGTEVTVAATPSVTGYTFAGWTTTDVTVTSGKFTMPDKNVTLTGVFTAKSYNVIYYTDTDKATQLDKQTKTFGTSVTVGLSEGKDEPTKAGHTFAGWKCVTSGVTVTDSKFTMPDSNVEFVPEWTVNKHTVTYTVTGAPDGYTVPASATVAYGTEVTVAATPSVTGYTFAGWTTTDVTVTSGKFTMPDKNVTLTGVFTAKSYNVIYYTDTDKATALDTQTQKYSATVTVGLSEGKDEPTKTGHTFSGWKCVTSGVTVTDSKFTMPDSNVEFVPEWTVNKHTVTYTVTGAPSGYTVPASATVAYGTEVTVAATPSVTGYTFAGWTTTDVTVTSGKFTMPDKNVTLTGVFTANTLSVIYYKDTDKATALDTQSQKYSATVTVGLSEGKSNPTKTGYIFKGWSCVTEDVEISNNKFTMPNKNVEFVPVWDVNKHTVTYTVTGAPDGYTAPEATTVAYGTEVTVAATPSVTGYTFAGWTTTDATVEDGKFTMPDKNVTLTGVFTANTLSVIYYKDTDKATALDTQAQTFGTSVTVGLSEGKDEPTKAGHTFAGWKCVTSGVTVTDSKFTMPDSNVEFVPEWTVNKHTVTYTVTGAPDGYTAPEAATVAYGTEVTVAATPSVTGYTFAGWTTTDVTVTSGKFTMPDKNVTLTGVFTANTLSVIYYKDTDKATAHDTQAQTFGTSVTVGLSEGKSNPTKTGYTFKGWSCVTEDVEISNNKFTMPNNNVEFVPVWDVNKHTVTYTVTGAPDGYTVPASATVAYGTEVTVADVPSVAGYTFAGWTTTDVTVTSGKFTMPDKNVTLTGVFTANTLSVIYYSDTDKATAIDTQAQQYKTKVEVGLTSGVDEPTKEGCTFKGWTCVTTGVTVTNGSFTMPDKNVEFVPEWELNGYGVTYTVTGGPDSYAPPAAKVVDFGTEVTVEAVPSVEGYTFAGWTCETEGVTVTDGKFTMPAKNVAFTGVFTPKNYNVVYYSDTDKATVVDTQSQAYASAVTVGLSEGKSEPTKTGYSLSGWKCVTSGITVANGKFTMPAETVEFVPVWSVNQYTVTYTVTGGPSSYTPPAAKSINYNTTVTIASEPSLTGYTFSGWTTTDVTVTDGKFTMPAKNVTVTGTFTAIDYTIIYEPGKDDVSDMPSTDVFTIEGFVSGKRTLNGTPTHADYNFAGWSLDGTKAITAVELAKFTADNNNTVTVTALWTLKDPDNVSITYESGFTASDAADGDIYGSLTYTAAYNADYTVLGNENITDNPYFVRTGYTFAGWKITSAETAQRATFSTRATNFFSDMITVLSNVVTGGKVYNKGDVISGLTQNLVFTAQWTANQYTVVYNKNAGSDSVSGMPSNETKLTVENSFDLIDGKYVHTLKTATPTRTGYKFIGWSMSESSVSTVTTVELSQFDADNSVTVYAVWEKLYRVYYDSNNATSGTAPKDSTWYNSGDDATVANHGTIARTGYSFGGWNSKADGSGTDYAEGSTFVMPAADVTLYANWIQNKYNLKYETGVSADVVVTSMPANEFGIEYELVKDGYALDDTTVPQREGYTFAGWKVGSVSNATKAKFSDFNNADMTAVATAQWTESIYQIVYNANSPTGDDANVTSLPSTAKVKYSKLAAGYTLSGAPKCSGYTFLGWSKTTDGAVVTTVDVNDITNGSDTINVYAKWEKTIYGTEVIYRSGFEKKYKYDVDGYYTDTVNDISQPYEILPNNWFSRKGYTFNGWYISRETGEVTVMDSLANMLNLSDVGDKYYPGDLTTISGKTYLTVIWELNKYNIKYDKNTSDEVTKMPKDELGIDVEENFWLNWDKDAYLRNVPESVPKREGYKFLGWSLAADSTDCIKYVNLADFGESDTLTLYAVWSSNKYKVVYNKNNSTDGMAPVDSNEYVVNDTVTVLDKGDLKCNDYTFKGWNTQKNGKGTYYEAGDTFSMPGNDVTLYAIWVTEDGTIVSPGTGESTMGIIIAVMALIISGGAGTAVILTSRRKKRA